MMSEIECECKKNPAEESCGLVVFINKRTRIVPCFNWAEDRESTFKIETGDYVRASKEGEIFGVYHSHVDVAAEFSEKDIIHSKALMVPYFVYSLKTKKHNVYLPDRLKKGTKSFSNFLNRIKKNFSVRNSKEKGND